MKLRKAIKRIAALGAGATLVGATLMGAMAADLSEWPSPFISNGAFTGVLVVGDQAAAQDVIGVTDIATSLQFSATSGAGSADGTIVTVEGDAWKVGTTSKTLELSENPISQGFESIRNITDSITADELEALGDGEVDNDKGTSPYHQYFNFHTITGSQTGYVYYVEDDNDVTADYFIIPSSAVIVTYEVEFTTDFESDIETGTSSNLDDFEDETLNLIGEDFTIVKADRADDDSVKLTLMSGPVLATLNEGETKTFKINDKEYEVSVPIITDTGTIYTKLVINGEITNKLQEAGTEKLKDGTFIGIKSVLPNEAGDVTLDQVEFYLGAEKVVLEDTNITVNTGHKKLEINGVSLNDVDVHILGTDDASTTKISNILINITADDDFFVGVGEKLSEQMDEPEALFTTNWDIEYQGLTSADIDEISVKSSGSKEYVLRFMDGSGDLAKLSIAYTDAVGRVRMGEKSYNTSLQEGRLIKKKDSFVVTDESEAVGQRDTWALEYQGADAITDTNPEISFKNLGSGVTITKTMKTDNTTKLRLGGQDFIVQIATTANDPPIKVDLNGGGAVGSNNVNITTKYGAEIGFDGFNNTNQTSSTVTIPGIGMRRAVIEISTPDTDDYEDIAPTKLSYNITSTTGPELRLTQEDSIGLLTPTDEDEVSYGYTTMGAFITFKEPSSSPDELIIDYPATQKTPLVYITAGVTKVSSSATSGEAVTIARIEVGATKLASEVSDVSAQNVIAVGGPCANSVAAEVKGNPANCAEGYEAGVGLIELLDNGENVALVVAGYSAVDTRNAAQVIASAADYSDDLVGTSVEVSKVGSTLTVAQPSADEPAADEPAADAE